MAGKRKLRTTLPKDLAQQMVAAAATGDHAAVFAALEACALDARDGFGKSTPLMLRECTPALARWWVGRGGDVNARNTWGRTALHESAAARSHQLAPSVLVELGADIGARSKGGHTPLHSAADGKHLAAVQLLLSLGADVHAEADGGLTPVEYALQRVSNADLTAFVPVAEALLAAGATVSPKAQQFVRKAAESFEFHRAGFNPDLVDATAAAAGALCALFGVEPPGPRRIHDGVAPIVATAATWQRRHAELWELLVPGHGACATLQGEVIRIAGRVSDELLRNGGANWDKHYDAMVKAYCAHVGSHNPLDDADLAECRVIARQLRNDHGLTRRMTELSVAWVERNPTPIPLGPTPYDR